MTRISSVTPSMVRTCLECAWVGSLGCQNQLTKTQSKLAFGFLSSRLVLKLETDRSTFLFFFFLLLFLLFFLLPLPPCPSCPHFPSHRIPLCGMASLEVGLKTRLAGTDFDCQVLGLEVCTITPGFKK